MTPGIHPKKSNRILIQRSGPQPVLRRTANGGRKIARIQRHISDPEVDIRHGFSTGHSELWKIALRFRAGDEQGWGFALGWAVVGGPTLSV